MPIIQVSILSGRSNEARNQFVEKVVEAACQHLEVSPQQVRVLINEIERENWYTAGVPLSSSNQETVR